MSGVYQPVEMAPLEEDDTVVEPMGNTVQTRGDGREWTMQTWSTTA